MSQEAAAAEEAVEENMSQEQFEALVWSIGQGLSEGKSQAEIVNEIVDDDADDEARHQAGELVFNVANSMAESAVVHSDGDGIASWGIWIGVIVFINVLSGIFDWPFWVY